MTALMQTAELTPEPPPAPSPTLAQLVKADRLRGQFASMPCAFIGSILGATLLAVTLFQRLTSPLLVSWLLLAYGNSLLGGLLWYRFRRLEPELAELPRWERRLALSAGLSGLIWGAGGLLLHVPGSFTQQIFVLLVMLSMTLTALLIAGGSVTAFVAFTCPVLCLSAVPFLMAGDGPSLMIGLATVALVPVLTLLAARLARVVRHTLKIQRHHKHVLEQLRVQKRRAEEACLGKSRFLAMASHDLRQPLHALRLFVQALQERQLPVHERELVANVRRSVDAMDELFDALLDISRLDAGAVRGRVASFPLEELFERLRFEFVIVAQQKGLRLSIHKTQACVRSDPDLLMQILRNLLSNALRYTQRGGVVMGCRWGRSQLRIEVWDSGCGIPPEQHVRVFQEFTQLDNPERDRRKGRGLGLAIVERLARLLSHPITLRSRVGVGTVFAVSLPRGVQQERARPPVVAGEQATAFDLSGLSVLVIEEDPAARASLERLLGRWGCQVVAVASGAQAIDSLGVLQRPLQVILVEYRLREQASGLMVLQRLEGGLGPEVPALVVMADSIQERRDCEAGGAPVLSKPVNPARLRTLLAHIAKDTRASARRAG